MKTPTRAHFKTLLAAWLLSLLGAACDRNESSPEEFETLTIHVAASLADVIKDQSRAFNQGRQASQGSELSFEYNIAGSGALAQQINAAPRGHLFFSANYKWLQSTVDSGNLLPESVEAIATNQLAMVAPRESGRSPDPSIDWCALSFDRLCIGDPSHVPAGAYAKAWLERIACESESLWKRYEDRILPAIDVRAALAQALAMRGHIAIVYNTDYLAYQKELVRMYLVPPEAAPKIAYYAGTLAQAATHKPAQELIAFLKTPEARAIFEKHGFGLPDASNPEMGKAL